MDKDEEVKAIDGSLAQAEGFLSEMSSEGFLRAVRDPTFAGKMATLLNAVGHLIQRRHRLTGEVTRLPNVMRIAALAMTLPVDGPTRDGGSGSGVVPNMPPPKDVC